MKKLNEDEKANWKKVILIITVTLSIIAPIMYILGPVLEKANIDFDLLSYLNLSVKDSYLIITISNAVVLINEIKNKDPVSITIFTLWVIAMGTMYVLH